MKKIVCLLLAVMLLASVVCTPACAAQDVTVFVNGEQVVFDVPPTIINSRTMVPLRAIFEKLGAVVIWDEETRTVTAGRDETTINVTIDSSVMFVNSVPVALDSPAVIIDNRTLVPVRAISEAFGCTVEWMEESREVLILDEKTMPIDPEIIEVSNALELVNAIGDNRVISLQPGTYDLSNLYTQNITNPSVEFGDYYGHQMSIWDVHNMTISGGGNAKIVIDNVNEEVLRFEECSGIVLEGLTVGHVKPNKEYECEAAVTYFENCDEVVIDSCNLFGCGSMGVEAFRTDKLFIYKTNIYECTFAGVYLESCDEAQMIFCDMHDCNFYGSGVILGNTDLFLSECTFRNIKGDEHLYDFVDFEAMSAVHAHMCTYENVNCKQGLGLEDERIWVDNEPAKG